MNRIKLQFLGTSEFAKHCNSCVYTQLIFSLKCVWKFPDNWRDLPQFSSKLDLCFQKAWFLELVLFFFWTCRRNDGAGCTEEAGGVRCFESSDWLFFIYKHRAVFNFISEKKIFFPSGGNDDFTNHGTYYGQCYGDLYSDTLFLPSFPEVFSAEILLLHVREVLRTLQRMPGDPH